MKFLSIALLVCFGVNAQAAESCKISIADIGWYGVTLDRPDYDGLVMKALEAKGYKKCAHGETCSYKLQIQNERYREPEGLKGSMEMKIVKIGNQEGFEENCVVLAEKLFSKKEYKAQREEDELIAEGAWKALRWMDMLPSCTPSGEIAPLKTDATEVKTEAKIEP